MKDRRLFLKVKIKSLAAEAVIIRKMAKKHRYAAGELNGHRTTVVRSAARNAQLAYGFIRGRSYESMERNCRKGVDWKAVKANVDRFGECYEWSGCRYAMFRERKAAQESRWQEWVDAACASLAANTD